MADAPLPDERLTDEERGALRRVRSVPYEDGTGGWLFRDGTQDELEAAVERILAARLAVRTPAPATSWFREEHRLAVERNAAVPQQARPVVVGEALAVRTPAPAPDRETVLELAALGRRAQNDPGVFVPRILEDPDGDYERLDRWQARAVDAAVDAWLAARPAPTVVADCDTCLDEGVTLTMVPGATGEPVEGVVPCPDCVAQRPRNDGVARPAPDRDALAEKRVLCLEVECPDPDALVSTIQAALDLAGDGAVAHVESSEESHDPDHPDDQRAEVYVHLVSTWERRDATKAYLQEFGTVTWVWDALGDWTPEPDVTLAARPAPDLAERDDLREVWVAFDNERFYGVAATREAAVADLDACLSRTGCTLSDSDGGWYEPQAPDYRDGSRWMRWYHNPAIVRGSQTRPQEVRRALLAQPTSKESTDV